MKTEKKTQVVILASKEKTSLQLSNHNGKLVVSDMEMIRDFTTSQHLYFLSDDDIKEDNVKSTDWFLNPTDNTLFQVSDDEMIVIKNVKQIISSTDKSLGLPRPSNAFIQKYVEEYNKGNIITKVMVEYELFHGINTSVAEISAISGNNEKDWKGRGDLRDYKLKIKPDNSIIISSVEETWRDFMMKMAKHFNFEPNEGTEEQLKWCEANYEVPKQIKS